MLTGGENRKVLRGVRWEEYLALLAHREDTPGRFTFDRGVLEIMTTSFEHENLKTFIARLIFALAAELKIEVVAAGSLTLRRDDLEKGSEPDEGFYVLNAPRVRDKKQIHLPDDPAPDLVVEVEITRSAIPRLPLYAAMGVPELWRHDGSRITMYVLGKDGVFSRTSESLTFPGLHAADLERFIAERRAEGETATTAAFGKWVRANLKRPGE